MQEFKGKQCGPDFGLKKAAKRLLTKADCKRHVNDVRRGGGYIDVSKFEKYVRLRVRLENETETHIETWSVAFMNSAGLKEIGETYETNSPAQHKIRKEFCSF